MGASADNINNKRIAQNTFYLYARMLLTMGVSIYTSRIVLATLGETDFGIYNVVGGFVAMFEMIGATMTSASQRFFSFELGKKDNGDISKVFSTSMVIHVVIALFVVAIAETVGVWFVNNKMNLTPDRYYAANWVFQCSLIAFLVKVISIPYNAIIIAYERMKAFAYVSLVEVLLKLAVAYLLMISIFDKLILYGILLSLISICIRLIYSWYVKAYLPDCRCNWKPDKEVQKEMLSFAGWNMFGATAGVANGQGINVILNLFFGPSVNAARGVTVQVQNAVVSFVSNFQLALSPQIIKSYAAGEKDEMFKLLFRASRFSFFLMMIISIPIVFEAPFILDLWLVDVPDHTTNFLRIVLLSGLGEALSNPLSYAMHACGKVRNYQIVVGCTSILALPVAYLILKLGGSSESSFIVVLIFTLLTMLAKLIMLKGIIGISICIFLREVVLKSYLTFILAIILPYITYFYIPSGVFSFFIVSCVSVISSLLVIYYYGIDQVEREFLLNKVKKKIK